MPRIIVIELSLVGESRNITDNELLREISEVFSNEEITIPWLNKIEKIVIKQT